jgi:RHS repeat-associated protein
VQLFDLHGNTVSTVDLVSDTVSGWLSYDEYGNPDAGNPANSNNINYTTYGVAERATNSTGLMLMGARVYNPETNQFTSPDPVKGGNENGYTYPNDPVNTSDFTGENGWSNFAFSFGAALLTALACAATALAGCLLAGVVIGATSGFLSKGVEWNELKKKPKGGPLAYMANGAIEDGLWGIVGFGIGGRVAKIALKRGLKEFERGTMEALKREFKLSKYSETITSGLKYGYEQLKNLKR